MGQRVLGFDVETTKLPFINPWQPEAYLVAVGLADKHGWKKTWIFNHDELTGEVNQRQMIDEIQEEISRADKLVGHNLKFDINWLRFLNVNFDHCQLYCTQVAEYLLRGQRLGQLSLADLSKQYLSINKIDRVKQFWDAGYETSEIPLHILIPYLEQDCINALAVYQKQSPLILEHGLRALTSLQCEVSRVLSEIECNGMRFHKDIAQGHIEKLAQELEEMDQEIMGLAGVEFNIGSGDELSAVLYGGERKVEREVWWQKTLKTKPETLYGWRIEVEKVTIKGLGFQPLPNSELKKKGYFKTDKGTIQMLKAKGKVQKRMQELLLKRSKVAKALETMQGKDGGGLINKVMPDGCIHSQYNQTVAKTGRLSSKDPNGQNLPRKGTSPIKACILPRFDLILNVDLSQIEWRGVAFLSQDPVMLREIREGMDPHTDNAIRFFGAVPGTPEFDELRTTAKIMTFRLIYGGGAFSFYMDSKMPNYSLKKWQAIVDAFYEKYKGLKAWQDKNYNLVNLNGGVLINPTGRRFVFYKDKRTGAYRPQQVKNFPVQSISTADVMPLAMCIIYKEAKRRGYKSRMIAQVHDSLVWDCVKEEVKPLAAMCITIFRKLPQYMKQYFGIDWNVPLDGDAEVGDSYGTLKKYPVELPMAA